MINKWLRSSIAPVVLFALAAALIGFGGINAVLAAPRIQSGWYGGQAQLNDIDVTLLENGKPVHLIKGDGNEDRSTPLLEHLCDGTEGKLQIGTTYPYELSVQNARNDLNPGFDGERIIDEFVRVTVYQYWTRGEDENETKATDLDPSLIDLQFDESNGWIIDKQASSSERTVLYFVGGEQDEDSGFYGVVSANSSKATNITSAFTKSLRIDPAVMTKKGYKDTSFHIEVVVDAVQTHSAEAAMTSAWGRTNQEG